jgi:RHS repeat-associated protein
MRFELLPGALTWGWSGRWESNPRPKLEKLDTTILKRFTVVSPRPGSPILDRLGVALAGGWGRFRLGVPGSGVKGWAPGAAALPSTEGCGSFRHLTPVLLAPRADSRFFAYTSDGLRVEKSNGSSGTLYWRGPSGDTLAETDLSGNTVSEYVFIAGRRISRIDASGNVYFYNYDQVGTTRTITDAQGNICYDADFTPYGQEIVPHTNTCPQNYKFAGYERDPETGLDYAFARYYSSSLARFLSPDPLGGSVTDPQSLNRYAYVLNNPAGLVDPLGLSGQCERDGFNVDCSVIGLIQDESGGPAGIVASQLTADCWAEENGDGPGCGWDTVVWQYGLPAQLATGAADQKAQRHCIGAARVIGAGQVKNPPSQGAYPGVVVTAGTAAVDPTQFYAGQTMLQAKAAITPYLSSISGIVLDPKSGVPSRSFTGVTDNIGGPTDRANLEARFGLVLEINGVNEPKNASWMSWVVLTMSAQVPCPTGTFSTLPFNF